MRKNSHFSGQPLYGQVIKLLAETRKLAHLGITFKIGRSTLADANKRRSSHILLSYLSFIGQQYKRNIGCATADGCTPDVNGWVCQWLILQPLS